MNQDTVLYAVNSSQVILSTPTKVDLTVSCPHSVFSASSYSNLISTNQITFMTHSFILLYIHRIATLGTDFESLSPIRQPSKSQQYPHESSNEILPKIPLDQHKATFPRAVHASADKINIKSTGNVRRRTHSNYISLVQTSTLPLYSHPKHAVRWQKYYPSSSILHPF